MSNATHEYEVLCHYAGTGFNTAEGDEDPWRSAIHDLFPPVPNPNYGQEGEPEFLHGHQTGEGFSIQMTGDTPSVWFTLGGELIPESEYQGHKDDYDAEMIAYNAEVKAFRTEAQKFAPDRQYDPVAFAAYWRDVHNRIQTEFVFPGSFGDYMTSRGYAPYFGYLTDNPNLGVFKVQSVLADANTIDAHPDFTVLYEPEIIPQEIE